MKKIIVIMVAAFMIGSTQQVQAQKWLGVLNNVLDGVSKSSSDNSTNNTRSSTKKNNNSNKNSATAGSTTALYRIHETAATKKYVIRGGATWLGPFSEGYAIVGTGKQGYDNPTHFFVINKEGEKVFDLPDGYRPSLQGAYESYYKVRFDSGRLLIEKEVNYSKEVSIIDTKGNVIKTFSKVSSASQFRDGIAIIANQGWGKPPLLVDINGNVISNTINLYSNGNYYWIGALSEGLRWYGDAKTRKYGYLDARCNIVIPAKFTGCNAFSDGLAVVKNDDGIWGYIDKTGKYVIEPMFTYEPGGFHSGLARVRDKSGKDHYIDKTGKVVWTAPDTNIWNDFTDNGYLIANGFILNTSFSSVAKFTATEPGIWQSNDDWFVRGNDVSDEKQVFGYNGLFLLECYTDRMICDGIGRHRGGREEASYYFNLKGEIIAKFEDTQF